jgi:hypothetical protein
MAEEDEDDEDKEPVVKTVKKQSEMLFVRGQSFHFKPTSGCRSSLRPTGDSVVLIAPFAGTS